MRNSTTKIFEPGMFSLHSLNREHAKIRGCYAALEKTIVLGRGLSRILEAANRFVQVVLQHFTHEEQFLEELSPSLLQRHRDANIEIIAQLFSIEDGLRLGKVAAVFQLLLLGDAWMKEHMQLEWQEFEYEGPRPGKRSFGIPA
jgi:hemerythrin